MKLFELKLRLIAPVVVIFLFICLGSPAPALATDQCSAPSVGAGTGVVGLANNPSVGTCGAVITVFTVDANGAATSFTVTLKGNGNPYDGVEDTLVGVQNNSSSPLKSMSLSSSPTAAIFGFDGDGPCNTFFHTPAYSWCPGATGYEGPDNTFSITNTSSGTVKFTTPIPAGGSTWFALEGTPASLTTVTQTATLGPPGTTTTLTFNTDTYKITGVNNNPTGGEVVTVTAFLVPTSAFPALPGFSGETIIPYADYTAAAGVNTGVEFQVHCQRSAMDTTPCNFFYVLKTGFTLPPSLSGGIGGVDFLVVHGQDCPLISTSNVQSIFLSYLATITDPTDVASSDGPSCEVPTYTVGATPITTGTASRLTAWGPPVDNGALNQVTAGATRPLTFVLRDILGNAVANLSLCASFTFTASLGNVCNDPAVPKPWVNITSFGIVCPSGAPINPLTGGTIDSPGNSTLNNNGFGNYEIGWKTHKDWQGSCANVVVTLDSGLKAVPASIGFQFQ